MPHPSRDASSRGPSAAVLWALYAGGFLGPFGGAIVNTMLPELGRALDTTTSGASAAITTYMLPFAALMPLSGVLSARWGGERVVRIAYLLYAAASVLCVIGWSLAPFLLGRALQGAANACTTPLLIVLIAERVPRERLGRSLGAFASLQAAGQAFAPLVGGMAAAVDYRWAFAATAAAALGLAVFTPGGQRGTVRERPRWASLLNLRLARASLIAWCTQFTSTLLMLLAALLSTDRFGLSPVERGLVVAAFGVAGLVGGRLIGVAADHLGTLRMGAGAMLSLAAALVLMGLAPWTVGLLLCVALGGLASTGTRVLTNSLAVASTPGNRAGATSLALSAQFLGSAVAPLLLPLYQSSPLAACLAGAAVTAAGATLTISRGL